MVDSLSRLQAVYNRWEAKNPHRDGYNPSLRPSNENRRNHGNSNRRPPMSQHQRRGRYSRNTEQVTSLFLSSGRVNCVAPFKMAPTVLPYTGLGRPLMGRCCSCLPDSKNDLYEDEYKRAGFKDIFQLDTAGSENGFFTRTFSCCMFAIKRNIPGVFSDVSLQVLTSPRLIEAIQNTTSENNKSDVSTDNIDRAHARLRKRASKLVKRMRARISKNLMRITGWFLHKFFGSLLTSILVHRGQVQMVKKATKKGVPLVFLPTHRSHLDYLLVTFILFNLDIKAPHVAAGDNLLIPLFGTLLRGLGGFFIRRRLDRKAGEKDLVYRAVLHTYIEEVMRNGEYLEFFIEGGRTRSGKSLYPKGGLLSVVVDNLNQGLLPDTLLVPVSISYDKILDGNFTREQMGLPKKVEGFWRAWAGILRTLNMDYGNVRVDFGQPFSLKEYMQTSQRFSQPSLNQPLDRNSFSSAGSESPLTHSPPPPDPPSSDSLVLVGALGSDQSLEGCAQIVPAEMRHSVQSLAEHIAYNMTGLQSVMSTQLLAFVFLTKYRKGTSMKNLVLVFDWLKQEILGRGRDLGFSGHTGDVIMYAQRLLGDNLIKMEYKKLVQNQKSCDEEKNNNTSEDDIHFTPCSSLPALFELSYYANSVTPIYALESVLAHVIYNEVPEEAWSRTEPIIITQKTVLDTATRVCDLLKYEFIFSPPCTSMDSVLYEGFNTFTASEILVKQEDEGVYLDSRHREWADRLASALTHNDDDSDYDDNDYTTPAQLYQVSRDEGSLERLHFYRSVLAPIFETFYITACHLTKLINEDMTEELFSRTVHNALKERSSSGHAVYGESAALDTVKNALRGLHHQRVTVTYHVANITMISLSPSYSDETTLQDYLHSVSLHLGVPIIPQHLLNG